ncbi:hypothetical protein GGQ66_004106 [Rhizobium borbori]|uniref:Uncharacterized protein n=1 Tax=Allorhizobium borbori TaxID=485907 RepID=A0A7W6P456_9HYPH|nr:hypothetical protein [Allorhizobium borbori]
MVSGTCRRQAGLTGDRLGAAGSEIARDRPTAIFRSAGNGDDSTFDAVISHRRSPDRVAATRTTAVAMGAYRLQ